MRTLLLCLLAIALNGCAIFSKEKLAAKPIAYCANEDQTLRDACNAAVDAIEKADILAASINTGLDDSFNTGLLTRAQALAYREKTKQADRALDEAGKLVRIGSFSLALNQATVTKTLLEALNKEIAAELAKGVK